MKEENIKDITESELPEDGSDNATDTDFEFIPSPTKLDDTPLFITEDVVLDASDPEFSEQAEENVEDDPEALVLESEPMLSHEDIAAATRELSAEAEESTDGEICEVGELALEEATEPSEETVTDEPNLLPEDILAATEGMEEQISFFDDTEPSAETAEDPKKERPIDTRFDFLEICIFTLVAVLIITTFFFRHSVVDGSSMEPTLSHNQHLILASFLYTPEAGDIIVCEDYSTALRKPIVKRIIATEGQTVVIIGPREIYVDGVRLVEDYANPCNVHGDGTNYPIVHKVAEGHVFVMGDHRDASTDSRVIGDISVDSIIGKVVLRFSPFTIFD